jgi:signal peptidase II
MAELQRPRPTTGVFVRVLLALFSVGLVGCDHATKAAAQCALAGGRAIGIVDGVLELRFAPNDDVAFSMLRRTGVIAATPPFLLAALALAGVAFVVAFWLARRRAASPIEHLGFAFLFGGAIGNLIDRLTRGYVVDFIHLRHWPIFNVADVAVVLGIVLVAFGRRIISAAVAPDD